MSKKEEEFEVTGLKDFVAQIAITTCYFLERRIKSYIIPSSLLLELLIPLKFW